jgi:hypothetical protein
MTDLINSVNKIPIEQMQVLYKKYESVLGIFTKEEKDIPYLAYIIDIAVNHIKTKYGELTQDWKTWAVLLVKIEYFGRNIKTDSDVINAIDEFVIHFNTNYKKYCDGLGVIASEFDRDRGFVYNYLLTKNGSF